VKLIPLKVTAQLATAVVTTEDLHLDSILAWVQTKRVLPELDLSRASTRDQIRHIGLPLLRIDGPNDEWVWASSAWELPADVALHPDPTRMTTRKDSSDIDAMARRWTPGSGPGRLRLVRQQAILATSATWQCIGQPREIRKALAIVGAIGSMRRGGYGRVSSWLVEETPAATVLCDEEGRAVRNLPWSWVDAGLSPDAIPSHGSPIPPYWHPALHGPIARPGQRIALRSGIGL